ncbi:protein-disulfide reductase DsbD [Thiocapsa marina]|uniref:Thiol:disulfide interchange protein DsbD n=1 Tax=Thiocapsa marina 5811 TaxID=768671 RepID=F9UGH0_9GAMM|nr:protein-disulfide reductase DsbD [Thiocapsa marina]EGV16653.1 Thiol:disulfide interchange protein dsbD [Thiocapsa marina 5811]
MHRPQRLSSWIGTAVERRQAVIDAAAEQQGPNHRPLPGRFAAGRLLAVALTWLLVAAAAPNALAEDDFLMPDQAFRISGEADGPDAVRVRWEIADGYYMYQSKFGFQTDTVGISTGGPQMPAAQTKEDEFFGKVQVYRDSVEIRVPVTRSTGAGNFLTLEATSQGCADAGLCYPPHRQRLLLELPEMAAATPVAAETPSPAAPERQSPIQGEQSAKALAGFGQSLGLGADDDILPAEEAFLFSAEVAGPDRLQLTWDVAEGTYLYSHMLELTLEDGSEVAIGPFERPAGDIKKDSILPDGSVGDVEVYHDRVDLTLPLLRGSSEPTEVTLIAKYQGCAEIGICYPPQTQQVTLSLPEALVTAALPTAAAAATTADAPPASAPSDADDTVSEQDRIASVLANSGVWVVIAAFFGFGLLLAFTPCVFPMIPILSGIIAGQGPNITTRKAFTLSLVYVLAMALTYTVVGVLAGLFGANLQAAFQNPWVLTSFALIFVLLALSMFGFYDLQLPSSFQSKLAEISNKQEGGTLLGVAIMGLLSALIVGPCVAPPLFGALIYISQTGDAVLGGIALFALSMGMGAPLIAIGTSAGKLLPRAGGWMDAVKAVFGVALLGVAIFMLERILPAAVAMLLWGLLLICSAVYMGALTQLPQGASGWSKLWKGLGVFLLIYGALMLLGAAAGGKDTIQPLRGLAVGGGGGAAAEAVFTPVKTLEDLEREVGKAGALGKPVMLDFYADWCVTCKELERYTFSDPAVIAEMGRFVLLKADVTANDADDQALMKHFGIIGPPAILYFDTAGQELKNYRLVGFKPADAFVEHLRRAAP